MIAVNTAIVLHSFPFKDNSRIVKVLCESDKMIPIFVNNFSKGKNKKSSIYYPGNLIEIEWFDNQKGGMYTAKNQAILNSFHNLHLDFYKTAILTFALECIYKYVKDHQDINGLFEYTKGFLDLMDSSEEYVANLAMMFLVDLSSFLGIKPKQGEGWFNIRDGEFQKVKHHLYSLDNSSSQVLAQFLVEDKSKTYKLTLPGNQRKKLIEDYLRFMDYHIDQNQQILSLDILSTVLSE